MALSPLPVVPKPQLTVPYLVCFIDESLSRQMRENQHVLTFFVQLPDKISQGTYNKLRDEYRKAGWNQVYESCLQTLTFGRHN